jgi:hypothetical protein
VEADKFAKRNYRNGVIVTLLALAQLAVAIASWLGWQPRIASVKLPLPPIHTTLSVVCLAAASITWYLILKRSRPISAAEIIDKPLTTLPAKTVEQSKPAVKPSFNFAVVGIRGYLVNEKESSLSRASDTYGKYSNSAIGIEISNNPHSEYAVREAEGIVAGFVFKDRPTSVRLSPLPWLDVHASETAISPGYSECVILALLTTEGWRIPLYKPHFSGYKTRSIDTSMALPPGGPFEASVSLSVLGREVFSAPLIIEWMNGENIPSIRLKSQSATA